MPIGANIDHRMQETAAMASANQSPKKSERQVGESMIAKYSALIAAIISALVVLSGYVYEKNRQREFEIFETRQEIYTRLIQNLTKKLALQRKAMSDPEWPRPDDGNYIPKAMELVGRKYPELDGAMDEAVEIMALLSVYGTDEAIEASARYYEKLAAALNPDATEEPDTGQLILELRRSLFPDTKANAGDINLIMSK